MRIHIDINDQKVC